MKFSVLALLAASVLVAAPSSDEQSVMKAMNDYRTAYIRGDGKEIDKLLDAGVVYVHSEGSVKNKAETVQAISAGPNPPRIEFLPDTKVRIRGNVAIVSGHEDLWEEGIVKHMYVSHVWRKTPQGWKMLARQSTLAGIDPASGTR